MGIVESLKGTVGLGPKLPKQEELQKERMRLSIMEERGISEIRRLKDKWKKIYKEGGNKDKYEQRALLRQMRRIEGDITKTDLELTKMDLGMRSLDKMGSILSKGKEIFRGEFWRKIEGTLTSDKLMDIMVGANFNEKQALTKLAQIANINDKQILDVIEQVPDEEVGEVWGNERIVEPGELDKILDKNIEARKRSLEVEGL